jgi:hypothetical protein
MPSILSANEKAPLDFAGPTSGARDSCFIASPSIRLKQAIQQLLLSVAKAGFDLSEFLSQTLHFKIVGGNFQFRSNAFHSSPLFRLQGSDGLFVSVLMKEAHQKISCAAPLP